MSVDRSLKIKGALSRHRNVLRRGERIAALKDQEKFEEGRSPYGLPKVAHRKANVGKKAKKKEGAEGTPAEGAPAAAAAAPASKPAAKPAAKPAKPGK